MTLGTSPAPQTPYPDQTVALLSRTTLFTNSGANNETALNIKNTAQICTAAYDPNKGSNFAVLWAGTNDLGAGTTAANVWGYIKTWCDSQKKIGYKTVVLTIAPRADAGWTGAMETQRGLLNASINGGDTSISAVANVASLPNLADPNNLTYYQDKLHLTTAGYGEVAALVSTIIGTL